MHNYKQEALLRRAFAEIIAGSSVAQLFGNPVYFRHPSFLDSAQTDKYYESFWQKGEKEGLQTEEAKLRSLIDCDVWTQTKEDELARLIVIRDSIRDNLKADNLIAPGQIKEQKNELEATNNQIKVIDNERRGLLGMTLEDYVSNELNYIIVLSSLYKDKKMVKRLYKDLDFEDIEMEEMEGIYKFYGEINIKFGVDTLKEIVTSDFFYSRLDLAGGDIYYLFGKPITDLTNYQYLLGYLGQRYHNILNNVPNIPDNVRTNYDKLVQWVSDNNKNKAANVEEAPATPTASLIEEAKSQGKTKLSKQELFKHLQRQQ